MEKVKKICAICGKSFEAPHYRTKRQFCSRWCARKNPIRIENLRKARKAQKRGIYKKCQCCGRIFYVIRSRAQIAKFCSSSCFQKYHTPYLLKVLSNYYETKKKIYPDFAKKVNIQCKECGKTFIVYKSEGRSFCSLKCYRKQSGERLRIIRSNPIRLVKLREVANARRKGAYKECQHCGKRYYVPEYRIQTSSFCNIKCALNSGILRNTGKTRFKKGHIRSLKSIEKARQAVLGEKNINWKGGITPLVEKIRKTPQYRAWRKKIYQRDGYRCVLCGENTSNNLNADHYPIPFSKIIDEFRDNNKDENIFIKLISYEPLWDVNNGRTLCKRCHEKHGWNYRRELLRR